MAFNRALNRLLGGLWLALLMASLNLALPVSAQPVAPVQQQIPGMGNAPAATGYWFASASASADSKTGRPVVIGLHGCGGLLDSQGRLNPQWARHAAQFIAEGVDFLALDSFSGRGVRSVCETAYDQRTISNEHRRGDVQAALVWLASQPGVDAERIAVVGWSHGAQAVLSLLDAKTYANKEGQKTPLLPRAAVAFYPGCNQFARQPGGYALQPGIPLLVMIGALDDWTPAAACTRLLADLQKNPLSTLNPTPVPFELVIYPDSYHGFDGPAAVRIRQGLAISRGEAHVGGNRAAWEASHKRLFDFLLAQFGQPAVLSNTERFAMTGR